MSLSFLKNALLLQGGTPSFFNDFFNKLAGNDQLKQQLLQGLSEEAIRATWEKDINVFKAIRKKYLLYPDFTS